MKPIDERLLQDAVAYIERWVEYRQRTLAIPGIAIAVRFRDRVVLSRAYGLADLERRVALTTDHVFRIASHSKTFTATAVMQLVEQGRLRLDDRAGDRLAWLPSGPGQIGRVTVRQLLSHSARVIRDGEVGGFWSLERDFPDADELREALCRPPVLPENQRFKYSNFGFGLLGLLVEEAAGVPYNDCVRTGIVDRLGLPSTGPEIDERARQRLATGYTSDHYGLERMPLDSQVDTRALSPATGFYSTAEDLCRFGAAHFLGNEELLTDESKREMQRTHWRIDGAPQSYGLGLDVYTAGERQLVGHGGAFPGFITNTRIDPAQQLVLVALANAGDGPAGELTAAMGAIIDRAMEAEPAADDRAAADLDRFTGRFWSIGSATDIVRFGGQLLGFSPELPSPVESLAELTVEGAAELRISKTSGFGAPGERVHFTIDDGGRVERVQWAASPLHPWDTFQSHVLPSFRETRRGPRREAPSPAP